MLLTACFQAGRSEAPRIEGEGTKFHPGHYVFTQISRSYPPAERNARRISFIQAYLDEPAIRGFVAHMEWRVLEPEQGKYNLQPVADILRTLEGTDKQFGLYIRDRNFGGDCKSAPVPAYLKQGGEFGKSYKHAGVTCMVELYKPAVMDRKIALYRALGEAFDSHPNFEMITDGETAIGGTGDFSHQQWLTQLKRFYTEAKQAFPHTMVLMQVNFLGNGSRMLDELAAHMAQVGGGALGLPDMVPCRRRDLPEEDVCGYSIPGYDTLRKYRGVLSVSPNAETWDLRYDETDEVMSMALDYLGADHVYWSSAFSSRRDKAPGKPSDYLTEQVLPAIKKVEGRINSACPEALKPCLSD
ncbi:hypothetical protein Q4485_05025 [Granulosicoccaceae sp. 1_MG-2023]|nr:hypothetical protein [Granulosicoccaceae sp. 1_MG-2023]